MDRWKIQKQVYLGLSRWWWCNGWPTSDTSVRRRGILDMGPWVSLIGMRLPRYRDGVDLDRSGSRSLARLRILNVLLHSPQLLSNSSDCQITEGRFWGDMITIGHVFDQCYRLGVLKPPNGQDVDTYEEHVIELTHAIGFINIWHPIKYFAIKVDTTRDIRSMTISNLWERLYDHEKLADRNPKSEDNSFRCQEMSLEVLRRVGKLKFVWTEFMHEHLSLDTEEMVLKIFWFGFAVKASPAFQ